MKTGTPCKCMGLNDLKSVEGENKGGKETLAKEIMLMKWREEEKHKESLLIMKLYGTEILKPCRLKSNSEEK